MDQSMLLKMTAPPLPYYLESGKTVYALGQQHPNREGIGVFDYLFVVRGTLFIGEAGRTWELAAGEMLLLLPDRYHYTVKPCEEETEFYWVHFECPGKWEEASGDSVRTPSWHEEETAEWQHWFSTYTVRLPKFGVVPDAERAFQLLEELVRCADEGRFSAFWREQQLFMDLLKRLEEGQNEKTATHAWKVAVKTETYIKQHYALEITNQVLSEALHFHPNYITRCMKEIFHCTPMEYLLKIRLEQAKRLLLKTDLPIASVADQVGFQYAPYFTMRFKKETGVAPKDYRNRFAR